MKNVILLATILFMVVLSPMMAQTPDLVWAKQLGGTVQCEGNAIAIDNLGNVYSAGFFNATTDFDPGPGVTNLTSTGGWNIFISKLDASGNFIWAKSVGCGNGTDLGLALDGSNNVYITGSFSGTVDFDPGSPTNNLTALGGNDAFILKLDASGYFVWVSIMGGSSIENGTAIALDDQDNVFITGNFNGTADFDPGAGIFNLTSAGLQDVFLLKLDESGAFIWARSLGGSQSEHGNSIHVDGSGNVYTTGFSYGTADFDPGQGVFNLIAAPNTGANCFISKLDANGDFLSAYKINANSNGLGITADASNNVYITGGFAGTADFDPGPGIYNLSSADPAGSDIFISKLDPLGNFIWARSFGGIGGDRGFSIVVDFLENSYVTGYFSGTADFDPSSGQINITANGLFDTFIIKLNPVGDIQWASSAGGIGEDWGMAVAIDNLQNIYATGKFRLTADFDPGPGILNLVSAGTVDSYVLKLKDISITDCDGTFTDIRDNHEYGFQIIGSQTWMCQNLAYLPAVSPTSIGSETNPYYYVYGYQGNDVIAAKATTNYQTYGVLYNWTAAMAGAHVRDSIADGVQGICPSGWHLPSPNEWTVLVNYLGGYYVAGHKLKSTYGWNNGGNGDNSSGFNALPGGAGLGGPYGGFGNLGDYAYFWESTETSTTNAKFVCMPSAWDEVYKWEESKDNAYSVRCEKDGPNGIAEEEVLNTLKIYPNPTDGRFIISLNSAITKDFVIELLTITGNLLYHEEIKSVNSLMHEMDVSPYSKGIYFLKISTARGSKIEKIVIR